jgi:hypothetical protein
METIARAVRSLVARMTPSRAPADAGVLFTHVDDNVCDAM